MNYLERRKRMTAGEVFWMIDGMNYSDCIAAYRFKGAVNSQADALKNLAGSSYNLTNSGCSWSSNQGFWVNENHYLDNSSLRSSGKIKSLVMKITSPFTGNYKAVTGGWGDLSVWLRTPFETQSFAWRYTGFGIGHAKGLSIDYNNDDINVHGTLARENVRIGSEISGTCVVGISNTGYGAIYINGASKSLSNATGGGYPWTRWQQGQVDIPRLVGGTGTVASGVAMNGHFLIEYLAVYSKVLSQSEHAAIAKKMV